MSLSAITSADKIYSSSTISIIGYNDFKNLIFDITGIGVNGYGYSGINTTADATNTNLISWTDWYKLMSDVNNLNLHNNNQIVTYNSGTEFRVESSFVNQLRLDLNTAESNRYNLPPVRSTGTTSSVWTSTYVSGWGTNISTTATLTWNPGLEINYFFNLGGRLRFELDYINTGTSTNNLAWQSFIDGEKSKISSFIFDRNKTTTSTTTSSSTGTITTSFIKANNTVTCQIELQNNLAGTTDVQVKTNLVYEYSNSIFKAPLPSITLKEFSSGTFISSIVPTKKLSVTGLTSFSWVIPSASSSSTFTITNIGNTTTTITSINFNDSDNVDRIVNGLRNGTLAPPSIIINSGSSYSFQLSYTGTSLGSYNSNFTIESDNDAGSIIVGTSQVINETPFSFTVIPSSVTAVSTGLSVYRQDFVLDITPSEATAQFSAAFSTSTSPPGSAGWSISVNSSTAAPIEGSSYRTGPTVLFSPIGTTTSSFTATAVLNISLLRTDTLGSASQTVNMNLAWSNTSTTTTNLGTWLSPMAAYNSVVGMSYDKINNERYLTIGVGMNNQARGGGDTVNLNAGQGVKFADVFWLGTETSNLEVIGQGTGSENILYLSTANIHIGMSVAGTGIETNTFVEDIGSGLVLLNNPNIVTVNGTLVFSAVKDPDFKQGQPQYYGFNQRGNWSQFLRNFGVWPKENSGEPLNYNVGTTAKYRFNIATTGTYYYEYSSDDDSSFAIIACDEYGIVSTDSQVYFLPDQLTTGAAQSNWNQSYTGEIELPAGKYVLSIEYQDNVGGPTAAAFQITDSSGVAIWNTRYPVRGYNVYPYWQEVMRFRIPAAGTAKTIYSYYQYVKNSYEVNNKWHWGDLFNGGLFKVDDDGAGNVTVEFFGTARSPLISEVPNSLTFAAIRETLRSLPASFYYYLPPTVLERYTNLDSEPVGDGTQTRYFRGFDSDGNVITVLSSIPSNIPYPVIPGGGSGGERSPRDRDPFNPGEDLLRPPAES